MSNKLHNTIATLYNILNNCHQIHLHLYLQINNCWINVWLAGHLEIHYKCWSGPRHAGLLVCLKSINWKLKLYTSYRLCWGLYQIIDETWKTIRRLPLSEWVKVVRSLIQIISTFFVFVVLCFCFVFLRLVYRTQCCQFLWIVHFWLPLRYSLTFIYNTNVLPSWQICCCTINQHYVYAFIKLHRFLDKGIYY